jgi:hypothetical protein
MPHLMSDGAEMTPHTTDGGRGGFARFGHDAFGLIAIALFVPMAVLLVGTPVALAVQAIIALVTWIVRAF